MGIPITYREDEPPGRIIFSIETEPPLLDATDGRSEKALAAKVQRDALFAWHRSQLHNDSRRHFHPQIAQIAQIFQRANLRNLRNVWTR